MTHFWSQNKLQQQKATLAYHRFNSTEQRLLKKVAIWSRRNALGAVTSSINNY
jgi:hypothetical protein